MLGWNEDHDEVLGWNEDHEVLDRNEVLEVLGWNGDHEELGWNLNP